MSNITRLPYEVAQADNHIIFDHFRAFTTAHEGWTSLAADGGTSVTAGDAVNGVVALGTAATDNNEAMVRTTNEVFLVAAGRPINCLSKIQFTEANTDDANVFVGFASAAGANLLVDDGAGPRTTGNLFGIYKVDGGTVWLCVSRNSTEVTTTTSTTTAGGSSYQTLGIEIVDLSTTQVSVSFTVDGVKLKDTNGRDIVHRVTIASSTEMNYVAGYVKAGGANAETLNIDYTAAWQQAV